MSSSSTSSSSFDRGRLDELVGPLADVACSVAVHLGSGRITLRQMLSLNRDTVIRLAQSAGEDLHVVVHGVAIATGEIVIVDESTALRVTQVSVPTRDQEAV
jgi:flagellar motor switch protein FliN/FliY